MKAHTSKIGPIKEALEPTKGSAEEIAIRKHQIEKDRECI